MPASAVRILVVGPLTEATGGISRRLERHGWASHAVGTVREAQIVLQTIRFPLVLAAEKLADGAGYDLAKSATEQGLTLMVGLQLSETWLWLPVVDAGKRALGTRALNPVMLEAEIERLLSEMDAARTARELERELRSASSGPVLREDSARSTIRRSGAQDAKSPMPPLRGSRKIAPPITPEQLAERAAERATGTNGKHWRG